MQPDMINFNYTALLIIMAKMIRQIRLPLIQPDKIIVASCKQPICFPCARFTTKDLKQNKEPFLTIESTCEEKLRAVRRNTFFLELFYILSTQSIPQRHANTSVDNLCHILSFCAMNFNIKASQILSAFASFLLYPKICEDIIWPKLCFQSHFCSVYNRALMKQTSPVKKIEKCLSV